MNQLATLASLAAALLISLVGNVWQWHAHGVDNAAQAARQLGALALVTSANESNTDALAQCQARAWELAGTQAQADAARAKADLAHTNHVRALTNELAKRDADAEKIYATDPSCEAWGNTPVCLGVSRRVLDYTNRGDALQGH